MEPARTYRSARPGIELVAQLVWIVGAALSYFAATLVHPAAAAGGIAATAVATLAVARRSCGWRALPAVLAALALQAPMLVGVGFHELAAPLGAGRRWPCFFFRGTDLELLEVFLGLVVVSLPLGALLRLEPPGLRRIGRLARKLAPAVVLGAAVLVALGVARLARFPTPDRYFDSLPLEGRMPRAPTETCTPLDQRRDPEHDGGEWYDAICATPDRALGRLTLHYHGVRFSPGGSTYYGVYYRRADRKEGWVPLWLSSDPSELEVRRDDGLDAWLIRGGDGLGVAAPSGNHRWRVYLRDVRDRISVPASWSILAAAGVLLALACFGASSALSSLGEGSEERAEWIEARRGELSLLAAASALCASALLIAALAGGFLS